jgi:RNA polymerase-binding transcription factor DksA
MEQRLCVDCNKEISKERLEVIPNAIRCVQCASKFDVKKKATLKSDPDAQYPRGW